MNNKVGHFEQYTVMIIYIHMASHSSIFLSSRFCQMMKGLSGEMREVMGHHDGG